MLSTKERKFMTSETASASEGSTVVPLPIPAGKAMDPAVALSLNVHAGPGVYALLLGSGVSLASGVKTGWGIVQDLVAKVAAAHAPHDPDVAQSAAEDPEGWWQEKFGESLSYSGLLAAVAPTSAARQTQLSGYFEPETSDGEGGAKLPTAAHRAIAKLVKRGNIRVILTTNFDRLMEHALQEVGISPQVVHRSDQAKAIKPLAHSPVTIIKLHGDYADLDQRNTVDELGTYPEDQQHLLDRVLDEYGLIVCGWSADWDKALVRAVEGTRSRRYPMFWSQYGPLGNAAQGLTAQHSAAIIQGMTADELFTDLLRRLEALDHMSTPPISRDMAVVRLKRSLADPVRRIEVFDLVDHAVTQIVSNSTFERRPLGGVDYRDRLGEYRSDSDILLHLLATGAFHDDGTHDGVWLRARDRLARIRNSFSGSFNDALESLRHYPALLTTWAMGVSFVLARREENIARLLTQPTWIPVFGDREPEKPAVYLNPGRVLNHDLLNEIFKADKGTAYKYPQSRLLRQDAREALRPVEPDDAAYEFACNRFEFLASMMALDLGTGFRAYPWAGEFLLESSWGYTNGLATAIEQELTPAWPLLQGGAFEGDLQRAKDAYKALVEWKTKNPRW
ncbi:SIR2 family protein [Streptomyces mirabilis]|uniref:SIR2 family protein n=1 Tax=Streptomyces mirabilis TaxID=68239 RepID=UPI00342847C8